MRELLRVEVPVHFDDIANALSSLENDQLIALILKVDLQMADVGFSEPLVAALIKSLKPDCKDVDLPYIDWSLV